MNILFLSGYNINPHDGGIARVTYTLANLFQKNGHKIWFLGYRKVSKDDNMKQLYFPSANPYATDENFKYLENLLKSKHINLVIVQKNPCKEYLEMLQKCKKTHDFFIVSCFHNLILTQIFNYAYSVEYKLRKYKLTFLFSLLKEKWLNRLLVSIYILKYRKLYKYIVDNSDVSVVLSEGHKNELLEMIGRKNESSIRIIPNCCNETSIAKTEKFDEILWVGSVDCNVKRIDFMIDVWNKVHVKHPTWILRVLGDGPSLNEMKKRVSTFNIKNIMFEGRVIPDSYYDRAKIICVTSVHESFSLVTIEAKMHGVVPIIQDSFPIACEIVNNGIDGILVKPFNLSEFSEELDNLMCNEFILKKYSENSRVTSSQYSTNRIFGLWNNLFESLYK